MKETIKYNAEYFRKLNEQMTEKQDIISNTDYLCLLEKIKNHVESSKNIETSFIIYELLGTKLKALLINDGFRIVDIDDQREGPRTEIYW